ncbi:helix-turn-helix domain-containing protein [Cohnella hongkongensis]|uniref:Helix-turn-helix domain-containing protein n=1 Tax=Cohnella hongkongensis TaxID=178337 RepID=A0ABV9FKQ0_9BACL
MKIYRKPFSSEPLFPFEFVYRDKKSPERELPDHLHDQYEFFYVYSGKATFFIDQKLYDIKAGDLLLVPGNSIHRSFQDPQEPVTSTAVFFAPSFVSADDIGEPYSSLRCFDLARKRKRYRLELDEPLRTATEEALERMREELDNKAIGYRHAVGLLLQQWLLLINRHVNSATADDADESGIGPQWMKDVLHYIAAHPGADLSLAALAKHASVTGAHFSRVFKQITGMNLTDYVNAKRIVLAKERLLVSDDNVSLIAERCGFESLPHFHRVFKKLTGTTPANYRRG